MLSIATLIIALFAPLASAQAVPDRSAEVQSLVATKYQGQFNGEEDRRRAILNALCGDLNQIDGGRWALLVKNDRNPPFVPADILVWTPTRDHVDVLTDSGAAWIPHGPIQASWAPFACAGATPPPVITPVPSPQLPPVVGIDLDALQRQMRIENDLLITLAHLDRIDVKLEKIDSDPAWLAKVFSNHWVQLGLATVTTYFTTKQIVKE